MEFRDLKADEIDVRVAQINQEWLTLLLYKDARVDMDILDETVGCMKWKREHTRNNANCIVSIYNEELHEWISKEDTGTESNTEKEKGLASDSFKRACVNWGIGRELYTAPFIYIPRHVNKQEAFTTYDNKGKVATKTKFYVEKIKIENKTIKGLSIKNDKGLRVFLWEGKKNEQNISNGENN